MPGPPVTLADAKDQRFDDYRALNDQAYRRAYEGDELFVAEGFVAIDRLIESGHEIRSVLLAPSRVERFSTHLATLGERGVPVYVAARDVITTAVGFDLHRGVVAVARRHDHPSVAEVAATASRFAVLEGLNDAENLGAIARAARALGIDALIVDPRSTDPYSRRSVRVSMGEILLMPIARPAADDWRDILGELDRAGVETWAMSPMPSAESIWDVEVPERLAVVLGAEGPGLDRRTIARATRTVRIPLRAGVDSLNVGHAAAVTFAAIGRPRST
ncbi:MAG: RNA methyltransferase [Ilumatobacteraceae bacterium]